MLDRLTPPAIIFWSGYGSALLIGSAYPESTLAGTITDGIKGVTILLAIAAGLVLTIKGGSIWKRVIETAPMGPLNPEAGRARAEAIPIGVPPCR